MSLIDDLAGMFGDEIVAHPGYPDAYGGFTASGAAFAVPCHISGRSRLVRDRRGNEVVSTAQATVGGVFNLTVDNHRYTLPSSYVPSGMLKAIARRLSHDEDGPHHETLYFP